MDILKMAKNVQPDVVAFRRDLHINPEPSMQEFRTSKQIAAKLDELGVPYRMLNPTGVIAEIKGLKSESTKNRNKRVALRADIDALSIQEKTEYEYKSRNDGFMHACGHDAHTAMLMGSVMVLNELRNEFSGSVRFLFQPAEEIGAGAKLVIAQGGMDDVDAVIGVHVFSQLEIGKIVSCHGTITAGADVFKLNIKGVTCHGANPHTGVDATLCGAAMVMNLQTLVSREFSPMDPLVVTVGSFNSGSRFNIISGEAILHGTLRYFNVETHENVINAFKRIVEMTAATYRCTVEIEYDSSIKAVVNDSDIVELGLAAAKKITDPNLIGYNQPVTGAEDFGEYSAYAKSGFFRLGVGGKMPMHSDYFDIDEDGFVTGVAFYAQTALDVLDME